MSENEAVDHPAHYGGGDNPYEAIKVIAAWDLDFWLGNTVKYISRAGKKDADKELEDLRKASWYLTDRIARREAELARATQEQLKTTQEQLKKDLGWSDEEEKKVEPTEPDGRPDWIGSTLEKSEPPRGRGW